VARVSACATRIIRSVMHTASLPGGRPAATQGTPLLFKTLTERITALGKNPV